VRAVAAGRVTDRSVSTAIAPTTRAATAANCAPAASAPRSASPSRRTAPGSASSRRVVERTIAWLHQYRRLRVRYERRADIHEAFLQIAGCLICLKLFQAEESF